MAAKKKKVKLNEVDLKILEILYSAKHKPVGFYEEERDLKHNLIVWSKFSENQVNYSIKKLLENELIMEGNDKMYRITFDGSERLETAMFSSLLDKDREIYTLDAKTNEVLEVLQKHKNEYGGHIDLEKGDKIPERFSLRKGEECSVFTPDDLDFEVLTHTHPHEEEDTHADLPSKNDIEFFCRSVQQANLIYHKDGVIVLEKLDIHPEKMEKRDKTKIMDSIGSWEERHLDDFWVDRLKYNQDFTIYLRNRYGIKMTRCKKGELPRMKLVKV